MGVLTSVTQVWLVEASFSVDITLLQACELAQKYEQNAIYWVENGVLFLVSCDENRTQQNLGLLSQYVCD
ncbi:hypothetical protein JCM19239_3073 [Vibrio variabilis]|uniref:Uncharacterized protein n=1 Tax=Vibrio variabilis TaxID=990271 RepID=A0ABQ0J5N2_9VIBR|nr:hypothetical protein JCM19239_3073 [Vibrio variabilis]